MKTILKGTIAFVSGVQPYSNIWSIELASGHLAQLTYGRSINSHPRWSPDGKWIAYISIQEDDVPSLWLMSNRGTERRRLTRAIYCHEPNWSPDSNRIVFSGNGDIASEIDICSIAPDGTGLTKLFGIPGLETSPSFAPDGDHIIFSAPKRDQNGILPLRRRDILELNLTSGSLRTVCSHPARDDTPVYSPNGSTIAFISRRGDTLAEDVKQSLIAYRHDVIHGSNAAGRQAIKNIRPRHSYSDIFIVNRDGTNPRRLTSDAHHASGLCWSPCGKYLAFASTQGLQPGTSRIAVVDAVTGQRIKFVYNRKRLEDSLETTKAVSRSPLMNLMPHYIARRFLPKYLRGSEESPHWAPSRDM